MKFGAHRDLVRHKYAAANIKIIDGARTRAPKMIQVVWDQRVEQARVSTKYRCHLLGGENRYYTFINLVLDVFAVAPQMKFAVVVAYGGLDCQHLGRILPSTPTIYPVSSKVLDKV